MARTLARPGKAHSGVCRRSDLDATTSGSEDTQPLHRRRIDGVGQNKRACLKCTHGSGKRGYKRRDPRGDVAHGAIRRISGRLGWDAARYPHTQRTSETALTTMNRCEWAKGDLYIAYHDNEWGVPVHDDRKLFEMLILEGAQAGLSWITILNKRENYRRAFDNFDARKVAAYNSVKVKKLLADPGIVRNRLKIAAATGNAKAFLEVKKEFGSFDAYIWGFVGGKPIQNRRKSLKEIPPRTPESDAMNKDLLRRGFKFVGSTICYAFMKAVGMVNDYKVECFWYRE